MMARLPGTSLSRCLAAGSPAGTVPRRIARTSSPFTRASSTPLEPSSAWLDHCDCAASPLQTSAEARRRAPPELARGAAKALKAAGTSRRRSDAAVAHAAASCSALSSDAGCVWSAGRVGGGGSSAPFGGRLGSR